jgi:hypothetical protein
MPTNKFFAYYFLNVRLHQYSKKKHTHKGSHKTVKIKVFLTFYCLLIEGSAGCSFLRAEGFSCSLQVIRGGRPMNKKIEVFYIKNVVVFLSVKFFNFGYENQNLKCWYFALFVS